jgi:hypothetical protein
MVVTMSLSRQTAEKKHSLNIPISSSYANNNNSADEPEARDPNMEPLPDHNIPDYEQDNGLSYMSGKRYVRNGKMPLDRFTELASTNLEDHDIVFLKLYEIYA